AGRAHVTLWLKNTMRKELATFQKDIGKLGSGLTTIGSSMARVGGLATAGGMALTAAFIKPIQAAGDLMETTSKFGAVFGDQTDDANKFLDRFTQAVGRGKKEAMDGMSAFQAFFTGMGIGGEEAAKMSQ